MFITQKTLVLSSKGGDILEHGGIEPSFMCPWEVIANHLKLCHWDFVSRPILIALTDDFARMISQNIQTCATKKDDKYWCHCLEVQGR